MAISCAFGFHKWDGCKCLPCGKTRDEEHDWSKNCEKCPICGKTRKDQHDWYNNCEKCTICGTTRKGFHNWSKDCEMCVKCGVPRENAHQWDGCMCSSCGKARDEGHDWNKDCEKCAVCGKTRKQDHKWNGCKCLVCGKVRDEGHDWNKDCEKCAVCGKTCKQDHKWNGCKCLVCGKVRDEGHDWSKDCEKCSKCGVMRRNAHKWDNCKCSVCGNTREHNWLDKNKVCPRCGTLGTFTKPPRILIVNIYPPKNIRAFVYHFLGHADIFLSDIPDEWGDENCVLYEQNPVRITPDEMINLAKETWPDYAGDFSNLDVRVEQLRGNFAGYACIIKQRRATTTYDKRYPKSFFPHIFHLSFQNNVSPVDFEEFLNNNHYRYGDYGSGSSWIVCVDSHAELDELLTKLRAMRTGNGNLCVPQSPELCPHGIYMNFGEYVYNSCPCPDCRKEQLDFEKNRK